MRYRNYSNGSNYVWLGVLIFFMFGGFRTLFLLLPLVFFVIPVLIFLYLIVNLSRVIFKNSSFSDNLKGQSVSRQHYIELLIHILVGAIKADGHIDQREIQSIMLYFQRHLGFNGFQLRWVQDLIQYSVVRHFSLDDVAETFNAEYGLDEKRICCELLFEVVAADGKITKEERDYVDAVLKALKISSEYAKQLKQKYYSDELTKSDYDVLGLKDGASFEAVRKAYRSLSKKYHPDKVQYLGDEFKHFSEQKIKEINRAYENIKKAQ